MLKAEHHSTISCPKNHLCYEMMYFLSLYLVSKEKYLEASRNSLRILNCTVKKDERR